MSTPAFLRLVLPVFVLLTALTARAATPYTLKTVVDNRTPLPDTAGNFSIRDGSVGSGLASQAPAADGNTVVFYDGSVSLWVVDVTSAAPPKRLVDAKTTAPGNTGPFTDLRIIGISNGYLAFTGVSPEGTGIYSIPVAGGTITTLANDATAPPNLPVGGYVPRVGVGDVSGGQLVFNLGRNDRGVGGGIYKVPLAGGAYTVLGDGTTPITGDSGGTLTPGGGRPLAVRGNTVLFEPEVPNGNFSGASPLYTGPITGLTVDPATGYVNNAARIAGGDTLVPGDAKNRTFDPRFSGSAIALDDSGAVVFTDFPSGGSVYDGGLYSSINGVLSRLADTTTPLADTPGKFTTLDVALLCVANGQVLFTSGYTRADNSSIDGIYTVPVAGGAISKVAERGDAFAGGILGDPYSGLGQHALRADGSFVFESSYYATGATSTTGAIFLATPNGPPVSATPTLVLSSHKGGDSGAVTLTVTTAPGSPALTAGAAFKLSAAGKPDITAGKVTLNAEGTAYTLTFDLSGQAASLYDLVLTNTDGTTATAAGAFTVEIGTGPAMYGDFLGLPALRAGQPRVYTILVGNRGNVDAAMVPVVIEFPSYFQSKLVTKLIPLPPVIDPHGDSVDVTQIPLVYTNGDHQVLGLFVPRVPAGSVRAIQVLFTVPDVPAYAHVPFTLSVEVGDPWLNATTGEPLVPAIHDLSGADRVHRLISQSDLLKTCSYEFYSLVIDCLGTLPGVGSSKCFVTVLQALQSIYLNLESSNIGADTEAISALQVGLTVTLAIADCIKDLGPLAQIFNAVQCGFDVYSLARDCFYPAGLIIGQSFVSGDPNDLVGSIGDGSAAHYLTGTGSEPLRYAVYFENEDTASAPAQTVTVTNPLDANLDLSTFALGPITFGTTVLNPPIGAQNYTTTVDLRPATNLLVKVAATLNTASRTLTYSFVSLDPATGQPTDDPLAGFLPPDTNPPAGDGCVIYYVKPKTGLPTGTVINDQASIVFDVNAAIATPTWVNTLDSDAPTSQVNVLPAKEKTAQIPLQLTSRDNGSGVKYFNLFVSEDGGAFAPLVRNAVGPTVTYNGVTGHSYAFFSQAVDGAGNLEPLKTASEAKTKIRGADLVGTWDGDVAAKTTGSGRVKLTGKLKVTNQSPNKATSGDTVVRLYLSEDATFDAADDTAIGADLPLKSLAPGASDTLSFKNVKVPKKLMASGLYVIAVINPDNRVKETDHANNTVANGPLP